MPTSERGISATTTHAKRGDALRVGIEIALVFAVFFIQGASPVPDVNEPYYLGKAIHYWNPEWCPGDTFLDSADTHKVFYFTLGWLSLWLSPWWFAWTGRVVTWALLAWSWRRVSYAMIPHRWFSVLTAALLVALLDRFHMAGEWVVGGVEAKGFAYVMVFLGLEALIRGRWNGTWVLFGAASAFHVLVGGWSVVAAGIAWLLMGRRRPRLRGMWVGLLVGFLLSLPGLLPSAMMNLGVDPATVREAHRIYAFERLAHHLVPSRFPQVFVDRFLLLAAMWALLEWVAPRSDGRLRLRGFTLGTLLLAGVGAMIGLLEHVDPGLAASWLRFYWFRLADVALPLSVALVGTRYVVHTLQQQPRLGRQQLAVVILLAAAHLGSLAWQRVTPSVPPADRLHGYSRKVHRLRDYYYWRDACQWVATSGAIPRDARFLTPKVSQTFKWYTGRSEVANWKDIPQDAVSVLRWWDTLNDVHTAETEAGPRWLGSLAEQGAERLRHLGAKYDADYVLTYRWPPMDLPVVYENGWYVIYELGGDE